VLVFLTALLLSGVFSALAAPIPAGRRAPDFARIGFSGHPVRLSRYRGKVVLLNFWATWCAPCQLEMPRFVEWQTRYGPRGLQILGVSMDDSKVPARALDKKLQLNYPVMMGDVKLGERYGGILGLPVTYLIDRRGIIRARFEGEADLRGIEAQLQDLLSATSP
jgi:peroxiredoxin